MTSATPKPRAGEHTKGPWRIDHLHSRDVVAPDEQVADWHKTADARSAEIISLRERERELVAALQAIASADIRYQSSEIAIKARSSNQNIAEQVTAYDLRQRAIEQARALLAKHGR